MAYTQTDGSYLYDIDVNAIANGVGGDGVLSGCAITASGTPDWITHVAAGVMSVGTTTCVVTAADKTHDTPAGTNLRWDLLVVGTNGTVDIVKGTEVTVASGLVPVKPNATASHTVIAHVYLDGTAGHIHSTDIMDARVVISPRSVTVAGTASATRLINVPVCTNSGTQTTTRTTTNVSLLTISSTTAFIPSTSSTCRIWNEPGWWKLDNETEITNHPLPAFDPSARSVQYYTLPAKPYVLDCPTNRMFGASVTNDTGGSGANAVDGNCETATDACTKTGNNAGVAWQWDMGASYTIAKLCFSLYYSLASNAGTQAGYVINSASGAAMRYIRGYVTSSVSASNIVQLQYSNNGSDWTNFFLVSANSGSFDGATLQVYEIVAYE